MHLHKNAANKSLKKFLISFLTIIFFSVGFSTTSSAATSDVVSVSGHGWGHGRGMGQYGALGYARQGWSSAKILDHYYGNTTAGQAPVNGKVDPRAVRVSLLYMAGSATTVDMENGYLDIKSASGSKLASYQNQAVRLVQTSSGYNVQVAASCSGPWRSDKTISNQSSVKVEKRSSASGRDGLIKVCGSSQSAWYSGYIVSTRSSAGYQRTVNVVDVDQYLRGVVPNESPASWDDAALESQSVGARSYVLAGDTRYLPYADTCDTARCQVYDGLYTTRGGFRQSTHENTDRAIKATENLVRLTSSGTVARTEFSSSTGGHTVEGDFPAVVDEGDSISSNPNHNWTTQVDLAKLDKYDRGRVQSIAVTKRNGLGRDGGRALEVEYRFKNSTLTVTGNQTRLDFGLKSDWFSFGKADISAPTIDKSMDPYVKQLFKTFKGTDPSATELANWRIVALNEGKKETAMRLAEGDYFAGRLVSQLYVSALGRPAEAAGKAYWLDQMENGLPFERVGVYFYGSPEYFKISGGTTDGFLNSIYEDLLLREPDTKGEAYWADLLNRNRISNPGVVEGFYASRESRIKRTTLLYKTVMGKSISVVDAEQLGLRLLKIDEIELAAEIAAEQSGYIR